MEIPRYYEYYIPAMELLQGEPKHWRELLSPIAKQFNLTEDDIARQYASGNGSIFEDRVSWALSYLNMAQLVDKPKRGFYQLNKNGVDLLKHPEKVHKYIKEKVDTINAKSKSDIKNSILEQQKQESIETPQEELYSSFEYIKTSIYEDIISTILSKSPRAFEELVVLMLQKMGYGGKIKDSGRVTQYTNDGGIDGIIKEDILGFGRIHIQAKRYDVKNTVQRDEIQKFVGALAVAQSNKGVFITTSSFSKGAIDYVNSLNNTTNIVLIDGQKLAQYIYDYSLGMQVEHVIEIKKLDADFWDSIQ